ncbi:MAG: 23S rRNA (pseudouridine(1915)-N(3))-methyltransferase RlmH [Marinilabiliales bacterium]|nr:23S rRNA (pseudouridine(1915)-N(3))-methyltransferase RlmH [Marinilabiliales bacterium]
MAKEAEKMLSIIKSDDHVVLLDEQGRSYSTVEMASWLRHNDVIAKKTNSVCRRRAMGL